MKPRVTKEKIIEYLLNPLHPDGAGKAKFFGSLGFRGDEWRVLAAALKRMLAEQPVTESVESSHGQKYIVDGPIETSSRKSPLVRTVWIMDRGSPVPRLVTAYPREEGV
ncbi:MAG: DUF6883 domain-containing protein [Gammaproteobacteria bacterium]